MLMHHLTDKRKHPLFLCYNEIGDIMSNNLYGLYEDIIGTLSTYFFVIDYWKNAAPRRYEKRLHKVLYNNISAIRTEINSFSILRTY